MLAHILCRRRPSKMTVHGLVYDMTAKAAREAALGAGGILHYVTAGRCAGLGFGRNESRKYAPTSF